MPPSLTPITQVYALPRPPAAVPRVILALSPITTLSSPLRSILLAFITDAVSTVPVNEPEVAVIAPVNEPEVAVIAPVIVALVAVSAPAGVTLKGADRKVPCPSCIPADVALNISLAEPSVIPVVGAKEIADAPEPPLILVPLIVQPPMLPEVDLSDPAGFTLNSASLNTELPK